MVIKHKFIFDCEGAWSDELLEIFRVPRPILPAVLALGEKLGVTGKEVLTAYIIGFEAGACISSSS